MRYFDESKYSSTPYHSDWKYALLKCGKGMGSFPAMTATII